MAQENNPNHDYEKDQNIAQYQGFCPYGYDKAIFISKDKKIIKGRFEGNQLKEQYSLQLPKRRVKEQYSLQLPKRRVKVTMLKVFENLLLIGYFNGSYDIVDLEDSDKPLKLKTQRQKIFELGFVRDFHLYKEGKEYILLILHVKQTNTDRVYSVQSIYIKENEGGDEWIANPQHIEKGTYKVLNSDRAHRFEHRREFYWLQQFQVLDSQRVAFQFDSDENKQQIEDPHGNNKSSKNKLKSQKICIMHLDKYLQAVKNNDLNLEVSTMNIDSVISRDKALSGKINWLKIITFPFTHGRIFAVTDEKIEKEMKKASQNSDPKTEKEHFVVVNQKGVSFLIQKNDGRYIERLVPNDFGEGGARKTEPWKPFDAKILKIYNKKTLLIAGSMGLYRVVLPIKSLAKDEVQVEELDLEGSYYKLTVSKCERILAATGRFRYIRLFEADTLRSICFLPYKNVFDLRMNSEQIFFKSNQLKCWSVVGLLESQYVQTLKPHTKVPTESKTIRQAPGKLQKVLCDMVLDSKGEAYEKHYVGIMSPRVTYHPKVILAKYIAFTGGQVTAVDLDGKNDQTQDSFEMLTQDEVEKEFMVICATLHAKTLYWLVVKQDSDELRVKRQKFGQQDPQVVNLNKQNLQFTIFGGFYLSVIRDNPFNKKLEPKITETRDRKDVGKAILVLADSRDVDIRVFDKQNYLKIDFDTNVKDQMITPFKPENEALKIDQDEHDMYFVLNDGNNFNMKDKNGKQVVEKNYMCKLNAQEIRISPKGNRVVYQKDFKYYVAKIVKVDDKDRIAEEENTKLVNIQPIQAHNKELQNGLKNLQAVNWVSNKMFSIGAVTNSNEEPDSCMIYRSQNGLPLCQFPLGDKHEFLKSTTAPNLHATNVTGILDLKTLKVFDTDILSLLQLGGRRFNLRPDDQYCKMAKDLQKQIKQLKDDQSKCGSRRLIVLGSRAPALLYTALKNLEDNSKDKELQRTILTNRVFRASMIEIVDGKNTPVKDQKVKFKVQNMFQFLCKRNYPDLLQSWLLKESNYFADGISHSPMNSTTVVCAPVVNSWLLENDIDRTHAIYSGFDQDDVISILKLPIGMVNQIYENLTLEFTKALHFNSAILKKNSFASLQNFEELTNEVELRKISKELFEYKNDTKPKKGVPQYKNETKPKKGVPFNIYISLIKFDLDPGSIKSRDFLADLTTVGTQHKDIFLNKLIQKILDYKYQKIIWFGLFPGALQLTYVVCLIVLPLEDRHEVGTIMTFMLLFMFREGLQIFSRCQRNQFKSYFNSFWNILDLLNIVLGLIYVAFRLNQTIHTHEESGEILEIDEEGVEEDLMYYSSQQAAVYSFMVLVSFINLLQYLRQAESLSFFIDLIKEVFLAKDTSLFFLVMLIMLLAFAAAHLMLFYKKFQGYKGISCAQQEEGDDEECNPYVRTNFELDGDDFFPTIKDYVYTAFGDFGSSDFVPENDWTVILVYSFAVVFMCLVMLNLLIGILSNTMQGMLDTQEQSTYKAKCEIIFDLETLYFPVHSVVEKCKFCTKKKVEQSNSRHLIFTEEILDEVLNETEAHSPMEAKLNEVIIDQQKMKTRIDLGFKELKTLIKQQNKNYSPENENQDKKDSDNQLKKMTDKRQSTFIRPVNNCYEVTQDKSL